MNYEKLSREELLRILLEREKAEAGGIQLSYSGYRPPWQIVRSVQPRRQKIMQRLSAGDEDQQASNLLVEGENLQAMVSLYKYRGQVDLVLTDPPYNTGQDFRYNDKWDEDPNDPDLGSIVPAEDGSRHSKWLRFMTPRLWMMKEMLKPGGVLAICIDHRELFRLGILMDQIFGEANRIGIINWQKTYSAKKTKHLSTATEYILVYAKRLDQAVTRLLDRDDAMNARYRNEDNDPDGVWTGDNPTASEKRTGTTYGFQSPFSGVMHYAEGELRKDGKVGPPTHHWRMPKSKTKKWLEAWGSKYEERDLGDGRGTALVLAGSATALRNYDPSTDPVVAKARTKALARKSKDEWPHLFFLDGDDGESTGRPRTKRHLSKVAKGKIPWTYWADEDYEQPLDIGVQSWDHEESGHSQTGLKELDQLVGKGHGFETVKPLRLFKKLIQIWCKPNGIVLDPFVGSGTTAHAVLDLNSDTKSNRRFIAIEQGRPERGDKYASTLTKVRIARAISGERVTKDGDVKVLAPPLPGGFRYVRLQDAIDGEAVLALEREEMMDLLLTTHWDQGERAACHLKRLPAGSYTYLFAVGVKGEGFFLVWNGPEKPSVLDREAFRGLAEEAKRAGLKPPFHVYARICTYHGPNIEFYQIPNRILEKLGFNEAIDLWGAASEVVA